MATGSSRKYKCPFCSKSFERVKLSTHIDKQHEDMINPESGYSADHIVFDICNKKEPVGAGKGTCRICKKPTNWNPDTVRYDPYCSEQCKKEARENYKRNMLKVYGKTTLLDDMEWQENKMLANRGISGKYRWSDGTYKKYVGSYELKFLEFCDNVLKIKSEDLVTPGPTIEYEYDGERHTWITDAIYLPYNLVFDIKDGGDNKNKREMPEYRAKQIAKEKFITDQGVYNYIRLTNNEFVQLLTIFAELKASYMEDENPKTISRIHEHMSAAAIGGFPPAGASDINPHAFIINYMKKNTFVDDEEKGYALSNDITSEYMIVVKNGKLKKVKTKDFVDENTSCTIYEYCGDVSPILREVYYKYKNQITVPNDYLPLLMTEFTEILSDDQLEFSEYLEEVAIDKLNEKYHTNIATLQMQYESVVSKKRPLIFPVLDPKKYEYKKQLLERYEDLTILQDINGYFGLNRTSMRRTRSVSSIYEISKTMLDTIS